jgi:ABC-type glycerol-3-phosphate transport system permease component
MRTVRTLAVVAAIIMAAVIGYGFVSGNFAGEGSVIWALAWGKVALVDLYVGLAVFGAWVAWRERSPAVVATWWVALIVLGNLAAAVYLVRTSFTSGDVTELLTGTARV